MGISRERADEINQLIKWASGGCIVIGAKKPPFAPINFEEDREIKRIWKSMGGWACYHDAILKIMNGE